MDIELLELYKKIVDIWESAEKDLNKIYDNYFWAETEIEEAVIKTRDREIAAINEQIRKFYLDTKEDNIEEDKIDSFEEKREILFQYCDKQNNCEECGFHKRCNDWIECENFIDNVNNVEKDYKFYKENIEED